MVVVHRYVGLAIATFLVVASLTGSIVVFQHELDAVVNPQLFTCTPPSADAVPLPPMALRDALQAQLPPGIQVWETGLQPPEPGMAARFSLDWHGDDPPMTEAFVDPYTGRMLGHRRWGDLGQGLVNLLPFMYLLHVSLALGEVGRLLLGIVALLWTIDCFVGFYLTLPARRAAGAGAGDGRSWLGRWKPSWLVKGGSLFGTIFTFHRASGLWVWPLLLMFAWSSVAILLRPVYDPVMGLFFRAAEHHNLPELPEPRPHPRLSAAEGLARCQALMEEEAAKRGIAIIRPVLFSHETHFGFYRYQVQSSLDITSTGGNTTIRIDTDTGRLIGFDAPVSDEPGDIFDTWLIYLHFGSVGGITYRILICITGVLTAILCVTGVIIWWKKRTLRRKARARAAP
jgi:uncharacterized iron-regulated membrane protein